MAFSPDGKRLASASREGIIKLWDLATGQETMTLKGSEYVAFSPDGWRLATIWGPDILIYDARPWTSETRLEQQALCLTRGMLPKSDSEEAFLTAIRENKTFTEEARKRALEYAPLFWRSRQTTSEN
jgi:WD40 repeat protein